MTNTAVKNKKRYSPVIKTQEDFNKEMQAAYNRLNYLRSKAKELGIKKVKTKKGRKNVLNRSAKVLERDRDYHFFTFWVRDRWGEQLEKKYLGLKKASVDSSKEFTAFHGRLFDTVQKFGTAEEKDYVLSLMEKEY